MRVIKIKIKVKTIQLGGNWLKRGKIEKSQKLNLQTLQNLKLKEEEPTEGRWKEQSMFK